MGSGPLTRDPPHLQAGDGAGRGAGPAPGPQRPLTVLYDADCGFCRWTLALLLGFDRDLRLLPEAIESEAGDRLLAGMPMDERLRSAHVVTPEGEVSSGGDAVPVIARALPGPPRLAAAPAEMLPSLTRVAYRFVAANRRHFGRLVSPDRRDDAASSIARHRAAVLHR